MMELLEILIEPRSMITLLVALSAFATVVTLATPLLQGDKMQTRMKTLAVERDKLRTANREALQKGQEQSPSSRQCAQGGRGPDRGRTQPAQAA
jgi:tight adherence protein C